MKKQDIIMVKTKELKKLHIVRKFIEKQIKQMEAAKILGISTGVISHQHCTAFSPALYRPLVNS